MAKGKESGSQRPPKDSKETSRRPATGQRKGYDGRNEKGER